MARLPRLAIAGEAHLLLQRGRAGQPLFIDDLDREHYLGAVLDATRATAVALHAYVLMDDHVHLLATPSTAQGLGHAMQRVGRRYVSSFNARHGLRGSPFEGRFRAAPIEAEALLLVCIRHLELNPVRQGIVATPEHYKWSSASHHAGHRRDPLITEHPLFWRLGNTPFERELAWQANSKMSIEPEQARLIDHAVHHGWAVGGEAFMGRVAKLTSRPLRPRKRGRRRASE